VHKGSCTAAIIDQGKVSLVLKDVENSGPGFHHLHQRLLDEGCTTVVMESSGSYWMGVLINPKSLEAITGKKTDVEDAVWLVHFYTQTPPTKLRPTPAPKGAESPDSRKREDHKMAVAMKNPMPPQSRTFFSSEPHCQKGLRDTPLFPRGRFDLLSSSRSRTRALWGWYYLRTYICSRVRADSEPFLRIFCVRPSRGTQSQRVVRTSLRSTHTQGAVLPYDKRVLHVPLLGCRCEAYRAK